MPEGHSVHRIARQFDRHFVGRTVAVSSPQGRFLADARLVDGHVLEVSRAVGKQLFLGFDNELWMRVHLGMYGAWDFAGELTADATTASSNGRMGQTNQRGTFTDGLEASTPGPRTISGPEALSGPQTTSGQPSVVSSFEDSLHSIGAPRRTRLRMAESEKLSESGLDSLASVFPPEPIGQVRARLLTEWTVADLRGPTACEVVDGAGAAAAIAKLGPDPLVDDAGEALHRFTAAIQRRATPIGLLLMDQAVVAGIGNVYRAELLFRARLSPFAPGRSLSTEVLEALWADWDHLLRVGVETGQMLTMDGLTGDNYLLALASRDDRHWVYHRAGEPCRVCGTSIAMEIAAGRKLYWCPSCQR